jgi:hypothetical protein
MGARWGVDLNISQQVTGVLIELAGISALCAWSSGALQNLVVIVVRCGWGRCVEIRRETRIVERVGFLQGV